MFLLFKVLLSNNMTLFVLLTQLEKSTAPYTSYIGKGGGQASIDSVVLLEGWILSWSLRDLKLPNHTWFSQSHLQSLWWTKYTVKTWVGNWAAEKKTVLILIVQKSIYRPGESFLHQHCLMYLPQGKFQVWLNWMVKWLFCLSSLWLLTRLVGGFNPVETYYCSICSQIGYFPQLISPQN